MERAELAALAAELRARAELQDEGDWSASPTAAPAGEVPASPAVFVGCDASDSGSLRLLDKILASIGLSRPAVGVVGAGTPAAEVLASRPRAVVALGPEAARALLGSGDDVGGLRGRWHDLSGTPLLVTYHPAALLRDETYKRPVWEDMKTLKRLLEGT